MLFIKKCLLLILVISLLGFVGDKLEKKVIRNKEFDIHFYVLKEDIKMEKDKMYYWFKSGEIHNSFGATAGKLLHKEYIKYYVNNQLAEKGEFYYGLKSGLWKEWYKNGYLKEEVRWRNGEKNGEYTSFEETGTPVVTGRYNNNLKEGIWINIPTKDTTWYESGNAYKEHPRIIKRRLDSINGKQPFFKRVLSPFKNIFKKKEDTLGLQNKKDSFFKRLFKKKEDTITPQ